jgi:hypothetical protein
MLDLLPEKDHDKGVETACARLSTAACARRCHHMPEKYLIVCSGHTYALDASI